MNQYSKQIKKISKMEEKFIKQMDAILLDAMLDCFKYWANRFPKRRLQVWFGMGTYGYAAQDFEYFDDIATYADVRMKYWWDDKYSELLKPFIDFHALYGCSDMYRYPAIQDIIYNPTTRTIEYADVIIHLTSEPVVVL